MNSCKNVNANVDFDTCRTLWSLKREVSRPKINMLRKMAQGSRGEKVSQGSLNM